MRDSYPDPRKKAPLTLAARTNLWPLTAMGYETWRKRALTLLSGRPFPLAEELSLMVQSVQPVEGLQFLDLGTSTGVYARALLKAGAARVYGLDLSPAMLNVALRKARGHAGFVPLLARAEAIPLPGASVDGVVVGGSWNEFPQPQAVVDEMHRVLKPGGRLWIMFSHRSSSPFQRMLGWAGLRFPTLPELMDSLSKSGFKVDGWRERSVGFVTGTKVTTGGRGHS
ncbi:MAG: methyltransferase domain-containing protein [Meiothermus sp.]|uniref:class I SAM-dependent methyltransferase n=1 Tax=Meiothermus sp. TaxID=1955249 RepID=UPI0025E156DD|nr:methyltransferase domain-containing protein [Meiothermus sp.]MCS7068110.1 methyltransferase domain-containing protein [Meiothermus sp.]MCX7601706.1 methyltransferase domain-containing protein [Meiothermus sp.]MDW8425588.1 methyltransferase domain-containing protein [Meiothermus sp.]